MKSSVIYILLAIVLLILDSYLLSLFPLEFFKPDLGIPFIIYTTLFLGPQSGLVAALVIGLFQEVLSNAPNGSLVFTGVSIFLLTTFLKNKLYIDSKYSFSYICSGFVVVNSFLFLTLSGLSKGETRNFLNILFYTIPNAVFTGFVSIFIFYLMEYLNSRLLNRE
jgi:rod shape-determining protein MreD